MNGSSSMYAETKKWVLIYDSLILCFFWIKLLELLWSNQEKRENILKWWRKRNSKVSSQFFRWKSFKNTTETNDNKRNYKKLNK